MRLDVVNVKEMQKIVIPELSENLSFPNSRF
jgi:hypothetical protein